VSAGASPPQYIGFDLQLERIQVPTGPSGVCASAHSSSLLETARAHVKWFAVFGKVACVPVVSM
jgi:hypothetical protein